MGYGDGWEGYERMKPAEDEIKTVISKPNYQATGLDHGVWIPALQSVIVGAMSFLVVVFGLWLCNVPFVLLIKWALFSFAIGTMGSWFLVHYRDALWLIERLTQRDFTGDGVVGKPAPAPTPNPSLEIVLKKNNPMEAMKYSIPYADKLPTLLSGLANGLPFTFDQWCGGGKLYSQGQWENLVAAMMGAGLIRQKGKRPQNGYELTDDGKQVLAEMVARGRGLIAPPIPGEAPSQVFGLDVEAAPLPYRCILRHNEHPRSTDKQQ